MSVATGPITARPTERSASHHADRLGSWPRRSRSRASRFLRRNPFGVLGLSVCTLAIYFLYWSYQVNDELRRFEHDETISSTLVVLFGLFVSLVNPPYMQDHMNRIWDHAPGAPSPPVAI
jgi:hypothetical protein